MNRIDMTTNVLTPELVHEVSAAVTPKGST
jgi:hypothetical protein